MENDILEIAKLCQYNSKAEAQAVVDYTEFIKSVNNSNIDEEIKDDIMETIQELIADELNHQKKLDGLYVELTGIKPNKE